MPERLGEKTVDELFGLFRTSGRPKYLAEVFDRTAPELLRLATHMAHDPASAEDLLQNTFLRAIRDARRYEPGRRVLPWLIGILENVAREEKRKIGRRPEPERLAQTKAENPISAAAESEFTAAVDEAIEALPETYRPVLVLHLRHGLQPSEIAHALRRSPGTVRSQLARGLQQLRGILPAGFASMLALTLSPARGLAAVRAEVMAGAASMAPTVPLILVSTMTTKKLLVAVGTALASLVLFLSWPEAEAADLSRDRDAEPAPVMAQQVPEGTAVPAEAEKVDRSTVSTAPADSTAPANLVVKVKDAQGKPAEAIGVIIRPLDQADPLLAEERQSSDHAGIARFEIWEAGMVDVRLDRSKGRRVQLQAGQTEHVELQLKANEVRGLVKDPLGAPIADAWIWVSPGGLADEAVLAVQSDADGRFLLRGMDPSYLVTAQAEDCQIGAPEAQPKNGEDLEIILERSGAGITGIVTDLEGEPIEGALVRIGTEAPPFHMIDPVKGGLDQLITNQAPITLVTDEEGWYRSSSAKVGSTISVFVRAQGKVGTSSKVSLRSGDWTRHDVVLETGSTIHGLVKDLEGRPVAGMAIASTASTYQKPTWLEPRTRTASDGSYRLSGLAAGSLKLRLQTGDGGALQESFELDVEETRRWDPVAGSGPRIGGRVLDAAGAPLVGMEIRMDGAPIERREVRTNEMGEFVFTDCLDFTYQLGVRDPEAVGRKEVAREATVRAGTADLLIKLEDDDRASAWLRAVALGPDGLPVKDARLRVMTADSVESGEGTVDGETGKLRVGPLLPGTVQLRLVSDLHPAIEIGEKELGVDEVLDLGVLSFGDGGKIGIRCTDQQGNTPQRVSLKIRGKDGEVPVSSLVPGVFTTDLLPVGGYEVVVWTHTQPITRKRVDVKKGEVADAAFEFVDGVRVRFELEGVSTEVTGGRKDLMARVGYQDAEGKEIAHTDHWFKEPGDVRWSQVFGAGAYRVEVRTGTGFVARGKFEVGDGDGAGEVVRLVFGR